MITEACRKCENWTEKDLIYCIGVLNKNILSALWFIYGDCYAANKDIYERIKNKIANGVNSLEDVQFSDTKELGRINNVDPLGITYLRIRGMWGIENPIKVFHSITGLEKNKKLTVNAIMLKEKFKSFPDKDRLELEKHLCSGLQISTVPIKSPNNPALLLEGILIKYSK
jgi:hypothetical protein